MLEKQIQKIGKGKFRVITPELKNQELTLDFNPIIQKFALTGSFLLIHWQARPRGYRQWGIYNSLDDNYRSIWGFQMEGVFETLQIPDNLASSIPSAVLCLRKSD